jgi:MSHA pilin protein MshD
MNFRRTPQSGFTMIEAAISAAIVAVMLASAISVAASAGKSQYKTAERATASALADAMLAEISALAYADPDGSPVFGVEGDEVTDDRTTYDDVDDYHGLNESAPELRDGTKIAGLTGWDRAVTVAYVTLASPDTTSVADTGLKRISVTITHNGAKVLARGTLRSSAR